MAFIPDEAVDNSAEISHAAFKLYVCYCRHRNSKTGLSWPDRDTVHQETGIFTSYVSTLKNELENKGWIECAGRKIRPVKGFEMSNGSTLESNQDIAEMSDSSTLESDSSTIDGSEKSNNPTVTSNGSTLANGQMSDYSTQESNDSTRYKEHEPAKEPKKNNGSVSSVVDPTQSEREIFTHWQKVMARDKSQFTSERREKVRARLRDGYTLEQIKSAINGCRASPFHMGENDSGAVYNDLTLICRNGSKLESFIAKFEAQSEERKAPKMVV